MFELEKGVPVPPRGAILRARGKYPFARMQVGDSFLVKEKRERLSTKMSSCAANWARANDVPWKFVARMTPDGVRVWRVE